MVEIDLNSLHVVLATDCGSTTTKAVLFERKEDGWHQTFRGEAPTTVEKPVADVTIGARNAFLEVQELSGRRIVREDLAEDSDELPFVVRTPEDPDNGIDLYVSTSSAGGGLQMIVAGLVRSMSTASAERAALGAGAIVMDAISIDDGREPYERISKIRHLRPDIVLLSGGTDGGALNLPLELAETILQADPRPRFGETLKLPVLFAGNTEAGKGCETLLAGRFAFEQVPNLRPDLESENLAPARDAIHELFLNHVMSHAPGYRKLLTYSPVPIIPTPAAVGDMVQSASRRRKIQILAVDIGGATTDVFSVFFPRKKRGSRDTGVYNPEADNMGPESVFNRTVSANLGMSYSVGNVLLEAGEAAIARWLPFALSSAEIRDRLRNKMIRPTSIPQTMDDLLVEQAVCREALRLAFIHHRRLATGLKGGKRKRGFADMFANEESNDLVDMLGLDLIIGSGGVLSHAPDRRSSALMLCDAYEPQGVTRLAVDSIFMMPHLGVFASVDPDAADEIFMRDCIVDLGTVIAPVGRAKPGQLLATVDLGVLGTKEILCGEMQCVPLEVGEMVRAVVRPSSGRIDVGAGYGKEIETELFGGHAGIILDGRGRPLEFPKDEAQRVARVRSWYAALGLTV